MSTKHTPKTLTVEQKAAANIWDHLDDALSVIAAARAGQWNWTENSACKYIELRIDMRDGGCLIRNREGQRINPGDLAHQYRGEGGYEPWPNKGRAPLSDWQRAAILKATEGTT